MWYNSFYMKRFIQKKYITSNLPKASLGAVSMLISFELGVSLLIGYFLATFFAGSSTKQQGRLKSLIFTIKQYRIHLHHWLLAFTILLFAFVFNFFILAPVLFYGFLGGITIQGIFSYQDWRQVIMREK